MPQQTPGQQNPWSDSQSSYRAFEEPDDLISVSDLSSLSPDPSQLFPALPVPPWDLPVSTAAHQVDSWTDYADHTPSVAPSPMPPTAGTSWASTASTHGHMADFPPETSLSAQGSAAVEMSSELSKLTRNGDITWAQRSVLRELDLALAHNRVDRANNTGMAGGRAPRMRSEKIRMSGEIARITNGELAKRSWLGPARIAVNLMRLYVRTRVRAADRNYIAGQNSGISPVRRPCPSKEQIDQWNRALERGAAGSKKERAILRRAAPIAHLILNGKTLRDFYQNEPREMRKLEQLFRDADTIAGGRPVEQQNGEQHQQQYLTYPQYPQQHQQQSYGGAQIQPPSSSQPRQASQPDRGVWSAQAARLGSSTTLQPPNETSSRGGPPPSQRSGRRAQGR